ncbi:hypothetical protein CMU87_14235 [Elizabethkingia anophelis]|nr:hypothetical protein [Elizabethkingia anophelis]
MDPLTMFLASQAMGSGGSGANTGIAQTGTSNGASFMGLNLDGVFSGIFKSIACLGSKAYNENDIQTYQSEVRQKISENQKSIQGLTDVVNDLSLLASKENKIISQLTNPCSKDNLKIITSYLRDVRNNVLAQVTYNDLGIGTWSAKKFQWYEKDWGGTDVVPLVQITALGKTSDNSDLPINGGIGQNPYTPVQDQVTYTQDEVDQMLRNSSLTSNLSANDLSGLMQLKTQLQNNPNCRGGIKDGKPYLDCSVTNDHTQNMIQVAGLALTAVGLIYMMTNRKKK